MKKKTDYVYLASLVIMLAAAVCGYLVMHVNTCMAVISVFLVLYMIGSYLQKYLKKQRIAAGMILLCLCIAAMFTQKYLLVRTASALSLLLGVTETVLRLKKTAQVWKKPFLDDKVWYICTLLAAVVSVFVFSVLMYYEVNYDAFVRRQKDGIADINTIELPSYIHHIDDLVYDPETPTGTYDIFYGEAYDRGVFVWLHGGSHIGSTAGEDTTKLFANMINEGYLIISADYAAAPEFRFPVPLLQVDRLISHLYSDDLPISVNTGKIILAGTGSGADIASQYITACTNADYAERIGFHPEDHMKDIIALYLCSGLYEPAVPDTGLILTDYIIYEQLRSYYDTADLRNHVTVISSGILDCISSSYPPVFLTEGNTGTFTEQAHAMDEALNKAAVIHESNIFDRTQDLRDLVGYSFDTGNNPYSNAICGRLVSFLRELDKE